MNSTIFLFIMTMALLSVPMIIWAPDFDTYRWFYDISACFMISWFILGAFYWISYSYGKENKAKLLGEFLWKFPLFLSISMGLSLHNSIAVFEGYIGRKTPFVRTPKFNIQDKNDRWEANKYNIKKIGVLTYFEGLLLLYFVIGLNVAVEYGNRGMVPLLLFLSAGYAIVFFSSLSHWKRSVRQMSYEEAF